MTLPTAVSSVDDIEHVLASSAVRTVFQPILDLDDGTVVGYEALARGPVGALERPDLLFAAARAAGRLAQLDELCRLTALQNAVAVGVTAPLTLFVNVEPEVLDSRASVDLLAHSAASTGLSVVLEITERALAARPADLLATVRRLRSAGWRIALDDVGADELSLAFMPLLRPDIVKLDLRLVQERPGPAVAGIMHAVNAYAEESGAVVLAEGIEDERHLAVAYALGARLGQGWKFGRPAAHLLDAPAGALELPRTTPAPEQGSPFACLPASVTLRTSAKPLLIEVSKHLEREAVRLGPQCLVLSTFQEAKHFTAPTSRRYEELAREVAFVAAMGEGMPPEPLPGVRGAHISPTEPIRGEWDVVVLSPHFSAALLARDLGDTGPEMERRFEFALTYDRRTVVAAAECLMTRVLPSDPPLAAESGMPGADQRDVDLEELVGTELLQAAVAERGLGLVVVDAPAGTRPADVLVALRRRARHGDSVVQISATRHAVVVPGLPWAGAELEARRVAGALRANLPFAVVSATRTGVASYPGPADSFEGLLTAAVADLR